MTKHTSTPEHSESTDTAIDYSTCYALPIDDILNYVLKDIDSKTFESGIEKGSFQFIYERHKNYLLHNYFNGNVLKYAVKMSEIFNPYNKDSMRLKDLNDIIKDLNKKIRLSKKYKGNEIKLKEMIFDYNYFIKEFKEKSKPIRRLINKHYKLNENGRI